MSSTTEGERIAEFRTRLKLPQAEVANEMRKRGWKWSQATVWSIEKRPIRLREAFDLSEVLGVTLGDLAGVESGVDLIETGRHMERERIVRMLQDD